MNTIYKYNLEITDRQYIHMPDKYKILSVQEQNGLLTMWAIVDTNQPTSGAQIHIIGTGNPIDEPDKLFEYWEFIDTVQSNNGLVWHVFDNKAPF